MRRDGSEWVPMEASLKWETAREENTLATRLRGHDAGEFDDDMT